jgi:hypothetical protein
MLLVVPATLDPHFIFCIHPTPKEVGFLLKRIVKYSVCNVPRQTLDILVQLHLRENFLLLALVGNDSSL